MAVVQEAKVVASNGHASESPSKGQADAGLSAEDEKAKMLKAMRQIEFYFADANLPFDRFMWALHNATLEHWVPISTIASFKRMREFASFGVEWVAKALRLSEELEVDETNTKVRRRTEIQEPQNPFDRSIYAKGFGKEEPGLQQKLEEFFDRYGKTNAVRMRRDEKKEFKGSVFVEFALPKAVTDFLYASPKPSWNGEELLIMTKEAYCDMKIKEKGLTGKAAAARKEVIGTRRGFNAFREIEKGKGDKSKSNKKQEVEIWLEFMGNKIRVYNEDGGTVRDEDVTHVKGATLKFDGCGGNVHYNDIKHPLKQRFTRAPYIQYNSGDDHGLVGFDKPLSEEDIAFVEESVKTLNSKDITWSIPPDEDEKTFQLERAKFAARQALGSSQDRKPRCGYRPRRGRGGRGGRGGGRGRDRQQQDDTDDTAPTAEKRKRDIEPDGGPFAGVRGDNAPPTIHIAKKAKTQSAEIS